MTTRHSGLTRLLLACVLAVPAVALAQTSGRPFTYRGQLTDNGAAANGHYDFEFALYSGATGGTPIDVIEAKALEIHDGLLDVPLDFIVAPNDGSERWVEVRMRPANSSEPFATLTARQALITPPPASRKVSGIAGLGQSYDVAFTTNTLIGNSVVLLGNVNVPAGSYVAFVRMQVLTGSSPPGNNFRLDCDLTPGFDGGVYRVGTDVSVERYVTFQGAATLANAGAIQFACRDGNGHTDTLLSGKLTVTAVGAVN